MNILLEGNISSISFPNLVQLLRMEQKTVKLEVTRVEVSQTADMYFFKGNLKYAAVNALRGEDAMFRITTWWTSGDFKVLSWSEEDVPEANVTRPLDWILMESMRLMDEDNAFHKLLPDLTSPVSFTQEGLDGFSWDHADPPEWIPHWIRRLPRSFSIAQLFEVSTLGHKETCDALKALLYTNGVFAHTGDDDPAYKPIERTRFDSFSLIVMEYVGYDVARNLVETAVQEMGVTDLERLTFGQMVDLSDRLGMAISRMVGFDEGQDAMRKLRARITSLL